MSTLLALLQFTTILPLGKPQDFSLFARRSWLYPLAGYVIGGLAAIPVLFIADHTIAAAGAVALVLLISGAHHFDGLLDLGDGLMAHGDQEKRVRALTDRQVGAGDPQLPPPVRPPLLSAPGRASLPPPLPPAVCAGEDRRRAGGDGLLPGRAAAPCPPPLWRGQWGCCRRLKRADAGHGRHYPRAPVTGGWYNIILNIPLLLTIV